VREEDQAEAWEVVVVGKEKMDAATGRMNVGV